MVNYLKKIFLLLALSALIPTGVYGDPITNQQPYLYDGSSEAPEFTSSEMRVRRAAVKVRTQYGHGSGTYILYNGFNLVITASHVVSERANIFVVNEEESVRAQVVYENAVADIAILLIDKMETRKPIKYRPVRDIPGVGETQYYSGYPSSHSLMTIRGLVSGYETGGDQGRVIMVHGYGWMGCSGSGVYDRFGRFVGVLWGVDIAFYAGPQLVEDMLWISPASNIDLDLLMHGICLRSPDSNKCAGRGG